AGRQSAGNIASSIFLKLFSVAFFSLSFAEIEIARAFPLRLLLSVANKSISCNNSNINYGPNPPPFASANLACSLELISTNWDNRSSIHKLALCAQGLRGSIRDGACVRDDC